MLCFAYERPAYYIKTEDGASPVIRHPDVLNVHGTEGYSIGEVDPNGYLNPDKNLAEDFVLVMGVSHTVGKELPPKERFFAFLSDAHFLRGVHRDYVRFKKMSAGPAAARMWICIWTLSMERFFYPAGFS